MICLFSRSWARHSNGQRESLHAEIQGDSEGKRVRCVSPSFLAWSVVVVTVAGGYEKLSVSWNLSRKSVSSFFLKKAKEGKLWLLRDRYGVLKQAQVASRYIIETRLSQTTCGTSFSLFWFFVLNVFFLYWIVLKLLLVLSFPVTPRLHVSFFVHLFFPLREGVRADAGKRWKEGWRKWSQIRCRKWGGDRTDVGRRE